MNTTSSSRAGLTMIEVLISTAVLSLVLLSIAMVTKTGSGVYRATMARDALRQRGEQTLDRIADALSTASKATFDAAPVAPFGASTLDYRTPTGLTGGVVSWSVKNRIAYRVDPKAEPNEGEIVLIRDVGAAKSVTTVLATHVADLLDGEKPNGKDDNGNGLVDEKGLSFVLVGDQLTVRVSLADTDSDGNPITCTLATKVRLRN